MVRHIQTQEMETLENQCLGLVCQHMLLDCHQPLMCRKYNLITHEGKNLSPLLVVRQIITFSYLRDTLAKLRQRGPGEGEWRKTNTFRLGISILGGGKKIK